MGRNFTASTHQITQGTVAIPTTGSLGFWVYPGWVSTDNADHVFFDCRFAPNIFTLQKFSDNKLYLGWYISPTDYRVIVNSGSYTLNVNAWNSLILTWDDVANESKAFLNGSQIGSTTSTLVTFDTTGSPRSIGNYTSGTTDVRGVMARFSIWNAVLTANEITAFHRGVRPHRIRPLSLVDHLPLYGNDSPEPNLVGGGTSGVIDSGTAKANDARVSPGLFIWRSDIPTVTVASQASMAFKRNPIAQLMGM